MSLDEPSLIMTPGIVVISEVTSTTDSFGYWHHSLEAVSLANT